MAGVRRPRIWGGATFAGTALLLLAFLVLAAMLIERHDLQIDVTRGQRRTLAPQTVQVLQMVDRPIDLVAFYSEAPLEQQILRDLVDRYRKVNPVLNLDFVDLDRQPERALAYDVSVNRTVILVAGDLQVRTVAPGEAELTGAIVRLLEERPPRVFFVSGHGEASIEDASRRGIQRAADLLRKQNFDLRILNTAAVQRIPREADALVIPSPETRFTEREQGMLVEYLLRGGRLMTMVEPMGSTTIDSLLEIFGVIGDPGFVVDGSEERRNLTGGGSFRIALALGGNPEHPITQGFTLPTLYPIARSLQSVQPQPPGLRVLPLVQTLPQSWSETDLTLLADGVPEFTDGEDRGGPLPLAYAVEVQLRRFELDVQARNTLSSTMLDLMGDNVDLRDSTLVDSLRVGDTTLETALPEQARLVVVGDVDFISNPNLLVQGNSDFFLACMLWLTERENRIALSPRDPAFDPIVLSERQRRNLRWMGIVLVPGLFLLAGAVVLWRRRRWV